MNRIQTQKQLLILAAPSCAGKSTLIKIISSGRLPLSIARKIKIRNLSQLPAFGDDDIPDLTKQKLEESMILHYDLFNNYLNCNYHQDVLKIIKQFDSVVVLTLHVSSKILLKRIRIRLARTFIKICLKPSYFKLGFRYFSYQWNKYQKYRKGKISGEIYQEWFKFIDNSWASSHLVLDSSQKQLEIKSNRRVSLEMS